MAFRSSLSRSFLSTARSTLRSPPRLSRPPPLPPPGPHFHRRRLSFAPPRAFGELGCAQSLLPLHSVAVAARLTSHLSSNARAFCELSQGTFCRTCQDR